ncbi:uncharacterized protein LOC113359283 [Papaver somniferum]|uniref:uncharacterized protein LOC113359283 n=1 Tax=Papaver somniferum TaxID=3469 RepID=UPI000E7048FC|nr:uncharacterized protein LOC113359283 [Papaver somniferum]
MWKVTVLHQLFSTADVQKIIRMKIPTNSTDILIWTLTRNGKFKVKSAYRKLVELKTNTVTAYDAEMASFWKKLWSLNMLRRIKTFLWKCVQDIIPSSERMTRVKHYSGDTCSMCQQRIETTKHIVWEGAFSQAVWTSIPGARISMEDVNHSVSQWIRSWFTSNFSKLDSYWIVKMANACWEIWKERYRNFFDGKKPNPIEVIRSIQYLNNMTGRSMIKRNTGLMPLNGDAASMIVDI